MSEILTLKDYSSSLNEINNDFNVMQCDSAFQNENTLLLSFIVKENIKPQFQTMKYML